MESADDTATRLPPALFMTDRPERTPDILGVVSRLPAGWGVIYRHFGAHDRKEVASKLSKLAARRRLCLLIAADPGLAMKVGADGVHWPSRLLPSRRSGRFGFETASAHNAEECRRAVRAGVDAVIISPVFDSDSPSAGTPIGLPRFHLMAKNLPIPAYGLGGIGGTNAARLTSPTADGIAGFAAVSSIYEAWKI